MLLREHIVREVDAVKARRAEALLQRLASVQVLDGHPDEHVGEETFRHAVVELGDVVLAELRDELREAARLFGNRAVEDRLASLAELGLLADEADAVEVHVGAGNDAGVAFALLGDLLRRREGEGACGFADGAGRLEDILDCRAGLRRGGGPPPAAWGCRRGTRRSCGGKPGRRPASAGGCTGDCSGW